MCVRFQRLLKLETGGGVRVQVGRAEQMVTHYIQLPARVHYAHARIQLPVPRRAQHGQPADGVSARPSDYHVRISTVRSAAADFYVVIPNKLLLVVPPENITRT